MNKTFMSTTVGFIAIGGIVILAACGAPPETTIKSIIKASVEEMDPVPPWVCGRMMGCRQAQIQEVRVIETGQKQTTGNSEFWPVKAALKGTCASAFTGGQLLVLDENSEVVFHLSKDEFGKWVAEAQTR